MRRLATSFVLLALVLTATPAATAQIAFQDINTGTVAVRVYNNGVIGDNCLATTGFAFNGDNGLCGAAFLWGISSTSVLGDAYILTSATGWTPSSAITTSTTFPYATLTNGRRTTFANATNNLSVELNAYWGTANPDFVVFRYDITNTGSTAATGYPGNFADWDVGGTVYDQNLATADAATNTLFAYDPTGTTPNYFGVTHLTHPMTGWRFSTPYPAAAGVPHLALDLWEGLTIASGTSAGAQDQRFVQGSGPVTIAAGQTLTFAFAMVGGNSSADFATNVAAARAAAGTVANESGPQDRDSALSFARPNPTAGSAELTLEVEQAQTVRVAAFDALGREVAVLLDGAVAGGDAQTLRFETAGLPAGVYVVRATGETFTALRRVIVSH